MEKEFITADWLREQEFRQTDTRGREFTKQIGERICDVHQNPISLAWCFATFSDELHHHYGMRNNQGYPLNYQRELKNLAPSFF